METDISRGTDNVLGRVVANEETYEQAKSKLREIRDEWEMGRQWTDEQFQLIWDSLFGEANHVSARSKIGPPVKKARS